MGVIAGVAVIRMLASMLGQDFPLFCIGCHSDGYPQILPEILKEFTALYPQIHLEIRMASSQPLLFQLLEEEKADIIFSIKESGTAKTTGIYREMAKSPLVCVCAATHPLAARQFVRFEDLEQEKVILFETTRASFFYAPSQGQMIVGRKPDQVYFCESTTAALILAKAGCGIFLLPEIVVPNDEDLVTIPLENGGAESYGVYYRTLQSNEPLKIFVRLVKDRCTDMPGNTV